MGERKISIVCDGLSSKEVLEWMKCKVQKAALLEAALTEKAHLFKALGDVELRIEQLESEAAVEITSSFKGFVSVNFECAPSGLTIECKNAAGEVVWSYDPDNQKGLTSSKYAKDGMLQKIIAALEVSTSQAKGQQTALQDVN